MQIVVGRVVGVGGACCAVPKSDEGERAGGYFDVPEFIRRAVVLVVGAGLG